MTASWLLARLNWCTIPPFVIGCRLYNSTCTVAPDCLDLQRCAFLRYTCNTFHGSVPYGSKHMSLLGPHSLWNLTHLEAMSA